VSRLREAGTTIALGELPPMMTIDEVAVFMRAPVSSVRGWISCGRLGSVRPGRRRLIPRAALQRFLEEAAR
jgi:excisionase family DNA binding protein